MYLIPSRGDWTALALAVLAPYVYVSSLRPSGRSALPLPPRLRSWLAGAVAEEEQELSGAIHPGKGGPRATVALALAGRGINRRSGALIIAAYVVFAVTVIANAIRPPF